MWVFILILHWISLIRDHKGRKKFALTTTTRITQLYWAIGAQVLKEKYIGNMSMKLQYYN